MLLTESHVDVTTPSGVMRVFVCTPQGLSKGAVFPAVIVYSEIYQVTGPLQRLCRWLAGHGYIAVCGDVYHEFQPPGVPLSYDEAGTEIGNRLKITKTIQQYDHDTRALIDYLSGRPDCSGKIGTCGMCLGGHLAFRAALEPEISACCAWFPTDIHSHSLGCGKPDDTLARASVKGAVKGEVLLIFGRQDPHIPEAGRTKIRQAITDAHMNFQFVELNAQHAFVRDEGSKDRYDPALTDVTRSLMLEMFSRQLSTHARSPATSIRAKL